MVFNMFITNTTNGIDWLSSNTPIPYPDALQVMDDQVAKIIDGANDAVWLLEHPHLYTAGTSAKAEDLLTTNNIPVYKTGRGGEYTYHGPGQRVIYTMLNLEQRNQKDLRQFIHHLEEWIILTLKDVGLTAERRDGRIGLWVTHPNKTEHKIAALGVRVRKWVTFHGAAINVNPDLSYFNGIVPCGIKEHGVTSLHNEGIDITYKELDELLISNFNKVF